MGEHLKHITVYKNFKSIVKQFGLDSARFHDLRHSYAVIALQSGEDIKSLQENLGHHSTAYTLDEYGHVSKKMKDRSSQIMQNYYQNVKQSG